MNEPNTDVAATAAAMLEARHGTSSMPVSLGIGTCSQFFRLRMFFSANRRPLRPEHALGMARWIKQGSLPSGGPGVTLA